MVDRDLLLDELTEGDAVIDCDICAERENVNEAVIDSEAASEVESSGLRDTVIDMCAVDETDGELDAKVETEVEGLSEREGRSDVLIFVDRVCKFVNDINDDVEGVTILERVTATMVDVARITDEDGIDDIERLGKEL